jgi:polyphosphate kinase
MAKKDLKSPESYFNRELSWLEFNHRVLEEGRCEELPLLERLKFLAIVSSNLDEFFQVRVAGLMQQRAARLRRRDLAGMTAGEQLAAIARRAHRMVAEHTQAVGEVLQKLRQHGLAVFAPREWTPPQRRFLQSHFAHEILPVLTPLAIEELDPGPLLPGLQLHVAAVLAPQTTDRPAEAVVVVPVPGQFPPFVTLPSAAHAPSPTDGAAEGRLHLARLEDVIAENLAAVFPGSEVLATAVFRITRDADVTVNDDDASDLLQAVEEAVLARRRRAAVRLELSAGPDRRIKKWLIDWLGIRPEDVYEIEGVLSAKALAELANRPGWEALKASDWPPQQPRDLIAPSAGDTASTPAWADDLWAALQDHDVMLFHPYESFEPVVELLRAAAEDPHVLAIKQTLYRTSGDSPIIRALEQAAENGKEVTALVELKARFDEARNVNWARRLEDAGAHVIYGIAGLKTHAKALLLVRRESRGICRYVHLATGNYNDRTARLYSDIGLMTCDRDLAADVAAFFNLLTGYSEAVGWSKLSVAPTGLKQRFVELIEREAQVSTPGEPGLIMAKVNSLEDPEICRALYGASHAGVKVMLNVRGICCLRPGVEGISENIEVRSIVDRFLEHARIFYFRNGGHEEVYLSSADWMRRNLDRRLEILFPVTNPSLRRRLIDMLGTFFADNVKARRLLPDGTYQPVPCQGKPVRAQEKFHQDAIEAVHAAEQTARQFRPLSRPDE